MRRSDGARSRRVYPCLTLSPLSATNATHPPDKRNRFHDRSFDIFPHRNLFLTFRHELRMSWCIAMHTYAHLMCHGMAIPWYAYDPLNHPLDFESSESIFRRSVRLIKTVLINLTDIQILVLPRGQIAPVRLLTILPNFDFPSSFSIVGGSNFQR